MNGRTGMSWDEYDELVKAVRQRFSLGEIDQDEFRRKLALLNFTATEIDAEVRENEP